MHYIPATPDDVREMLSAIGLESLKDLFPTIPAPLKLNRPLNVPRALSELDLNRLMTNLAERNQGHRFTSFLGGGVYNHFAPAAIDSLIGRSEFSTAYTPYQPEISQGTLQAIFEFQSYVCELFAMEVANASVYDAASALAEACLMADRIQRKNSSNRVLISRAVNPQYRKVVRTYVQAMDIEIVEIPAGPDGRTDAEAFAREAEKGAMAIVVQTPNYFGVIEDLRVYQALSEKLEAAYVVAVSEAVSMGVLEPPGRFGADIVIAEGQTFGLPVSFGGPYAGMFCTRDKHVRAMPGRLVGRTVDADGEEGFVLTLATREQHIRREKATSNICTNQGLYALVATIYLSLVGKQGLQALARNNLSKAIWLKKAIAEVPGFEVAFDQPSFNEFTVRSTRLPVETLLRRLEHRQILGGVPLAPDYADLEQCFLVAVTETVTREEMEHFVELLRTEGQQ